MPALSEVEFEKQVLFNGAKVNLKLLLHPFLSNAKYSTKVEKTMVLVRTGIYVRGMFGLI